MSQHLLSSLVITAAGCMQLDDATSLVQVQRVPEQLLGHFLRPELLGGVLVAFEGLRDGAQLEALPQAVRDKLEMIRCMALHLVLALLLEGHVELLVVYQWWVAAGWRGGHKVLGAWSGGVQLASHTTGCIW